MDFGLHRVGPSRLLWIKDGLPLGHGHEQDVIRRRLRSNALGKADRLEHRVGVRQCDDAGDRHVDRCRTDPVDRNGIARSDVKIGGRLRGDQNAVR
ncbi:hypothetical protein ES703_118014 [subsurface metagenome]